MSNKKKRQPEKSSNAPLSIFGVIGIVYGLWCVITQSMVVSDSFAPDVTWTLQGEKAVLTGSAIIVFSAYFIYIALTTKSH